MAKCHIFGWKRDGKDIKLWHHCGDHRKWGCDCATSALKTALSSPWVACDGLGYPLLPGVSLWGHLQAAVSWEFLQRLVVHLPLRLSFPDFMRKNLILKMCRWPSAWISAAFYGGSNCTHKFLKEVESWKCCSKFLFAQVCIYGFCCFCFDK